MNGRGMEHARSWRQERERWNDVNILLTYEILKKYIKFFKRREIILNTHLSLFIYHHLSSIYHFLSFVIIYSFISIEANLQCNIASAQKWELLALRIQLCCPLQSLRFTTIILNYSDLHCSFTHSYQYIMPSN